MISFKDVTRISHAEKGGKYKGGRAQLNEEFGCHCIVVWVFRYTLEGLHLSHRPSTSVVSVPLV